MRLRDALSGELRELTPGADGVIGLYVCGPTVYGRIHIGNARPYVVSVLIRDYLRWRGLEVRLVENITDINDKIYNAARPLGIPSAQLARKMAQHYIDDTDRLGLARPDVEPRATETIPEIVALIEELVAADHAYESGGDVYFSVRSYPSYGQLSHQRVDDLEAGARVEPGEHKRDPADFVLWKANKPDEDTWWDSPWGRGRPGWHIECSAMAEKFLGREFAMHGGGLDLIFPHHENEVAQSQAVGRGFAQVWAHNGMLRLAGEKMSKSQGNIDPLHEALDRWGAETLIMFMLRAHYASPVDYTDDVLEQARAACQTLRNRLRDAPDGELDPASPLLARVREVLDEDFGTPQALAALFEASAAEAPAVREALGVLGLGGLADDPEPPRAVIELAERRRTARAGGDYAESDRLRDQIADAGWEVRDSAGGYRLFPRG